MMDRLLPLIQQPLPLVHRGPDFSSGHYSSSEAIQWQIQTLFQGAIPRRLISSDSPRSSHSGLCCNALGDRQKGFSQPIWCPPWVTVVIEGFWLNRVHPQRRFSFLPPESRSLVIAAIQTHPLMYSDFSLDHLIFIQSVHYHVYNRTSFGYATPSCCMKWHSVMDWCLAALFSENKQDLHNEPVWKRLV